MSRDRNFRFHTEHDPKELWEEFRIVVVVTIEVVTNLGN